MRRRPCPPRIQLKPVAVRGLLGRLVISQNEVSRRRGFSPGHLSMPMNGRRSPSPRARRGLLEVLGVDDLDLLFITEPPEAAGWKPEERGVPKRKKGRTNAGSAAATLTCAIDGNAPGSTGPRP